MLLRSMSGLIAESAAFICFFCSRKTAKGFKPSTPSDFIGGWWWSIISNGCWLGCCKGCNEPSVCANSFILCSQVTADQFLCRSWWHHHGEDHMVSNTHARTYTQVICFVFYSADKMSFILKHVNINYMSLTMLLTLSCMFVHINKQKINCGDVVIYSLVSLCFFISNQMFCSTSSCNSLPLYKCKLCHSWSIYKDFCRLLERWITQTTLRHVENNTEKIHI